MLCSRIAKMNLKDKLIKLVPALSFLLTVPCYSFELSTGPLHVKNVLIEGNKLISDSEIRACIKTKPGDKFDRDQVMEDLKAINEMGYFEDKVLQVTPKREPGNLVSLQFLVQENATVKRFLVKGNKLLTTEDILLSLNDQVGKPQNIDQLSKSVDEIEKKYHDRGFLIARVTDVKDKPDGEVSLQINEGIIDQIEVLGNVKDPASVRKALRLKAGDVYDEHQLTKDMRKLYAKGGLSDIRRSLEPSTLNPDNFVLKIDVERAWDSKSERKKFEGPKNSPLVSPVNYGIQLGSPNYKGPGYKYFGPERIEPLEIPWHSSYSRKKRGMSSDLPILGQFLMK